MKWIFEAYSNVYKAAMMDRDSLLGHAADAKSEAPKSREDRLSRRRRDH
jgi:hypothetical protein